VYDIYSHFNGPGAKPMHLRITYHLYHSVRVTKYYLVFVILQNNCYGRVTIEKCVYVHLERHINNPV